MINIRKKFIDLESAFWKKRRSNLKPSVFQHDYLALVSLVQDIQEGISLVQKKSTKRKFAIIDIGCGEKPYKKLFNPITKKYLGVDLTLDADIVAPAEKLPIPDESFDLALHFQVFEHLENPERSVKEMLRVLKKDGFVLASTHGIWNYHPFPHDYYRWTHEGLEKLFKEFSFVLVKPNLKSYATIIQLINIELYTLACNHIIFKIPCSLLIILLNYIGQFLIPYGQKHLAIGYLIIAKK